MCSVLELVKKIEEVELRRNVEGAVEGVVEAAEDVGGEEESREEHSCFKSSLIAV